MTVSQIVEYSTQTGDAAIAAQSAYFQGFTIMPDGTNDVTVAFYDNASAASGDKFIPTLTFAGNGGAQKFTPPISILVQNGIYIDVTTAGTVEYTVYFNYR